MRSQRMAIGYNYIDNPDYTWEEENGDGGEIDYLADLVVEGNVGIGTTVPAECLDVNGFIRATPIFGQWQHGAHQYSTDTTVIILFGSENVNTNTEYFGLLGDQTGVLIKKAGYYYFEGSVDAMTYTYTGRFDMFLSNSNGGNVAYSIYQMRSAGTNTYNSYFVSGMAYVAANSTISMKLSSTTAADWFIHSSLARLRIYRLN
jgi:hypothetical protein